MSFLGWLEHSDLIIFVGEIAFSKIRCRTLGEKNEQDFSALCKQNEILILYWKPVNNILKMIDFKANRRHIENRFFILYDLSSYLKHSFDKFKSLFLKRSFS